MEIHFHGAAQTVTGSQHLLLINGKKILLDCGLYQGKRADANLRNRTFPFNPAEVDVLILSHAHIDHSGNIPNLVKSGFKGDIICTSPTRDLCVNMLQDSAHIQEKDAEFFNRKMKKHGEPEVIPLYTMENAVQSLEQFSPIGYERPHEVIPSVQLTFLEAGHMLGSAIVALEISDQAAKRDLRLVFSGDLGRRTLPILRDPTNVTQADVLIMESTYGDRKHPPEADLEAEMVSIVQDAIQRKGAIIIPAFAVGRTQQLVYLFQKLISDHRIPELPIFVDSPLATDVTAVFRNHPEVYDAEIRAYMNNYDDPDPFGFSSLKYTRAKEESQTLNDREGTFVVISASGMCEAGRILHHLRNRIEDPKNTIVFSGWQAPETLGRRILDGSPLVRIFGEEHTVRAKVVALNGLSGHADTDELTEWGRAFQHKPQHTFLVHGEPEPAKFLAERLKKEAGFKEVNVPALHQKVTV